MGGVYKQSWWALRNPWYSQKLVKTKWRSKLFKSLWFVFLMEKILYSLPSTHQSVPTSLRLPTLTSLPLSFLSFVCLHSFLSFPFAHACPSSFPSSVSHSVSASAVPVTAPPPVQSFRSLLPCPLIRSLFIYPSLPLLSRSFLLSTLPPFRRYSFIYSFNYESALFAHLGKSRTQRRERWNWCNWRERRQRMDGI